MFLGGAGKPSTGLTLDAALCDQAKATKRKVTKATHRLAVRFKLIPADSFHGNVLWFEMEHVTAKLLLPCLMLLAKMFECCVQNHGDAQAQV